MPNPVLCSIPTIEIYTVELENEFSELFSSRAVTHSVPRATTDTISSDRNNCFEGIDEFGIKDLFNHEKQLEPAVGNSVSLVEEMFGKVPITCDPIVAAQNENLPRQL